jgi:UDP-N-acetylglucosamine--N-acetylmuramyl-(pentapeptide) pyrophosphoryl-undecaprenol N-acetylglucosamine transferase
MNEMDIQHTPAASDSDEPRALHVVVAGGGTGGHLFPGIALAWAFLTKNATTQVLFMGTGNLMEQRALANTPFPLTAVTASGIKGKGLWRALWALVKLPLGTLSAMVGLHQFQADLVVGVGGYVSGPVVIGAYLMGIPIVIQEQNRLPGLANRVLGRLAGRIHVSFEDTLPVFSPEKVRVSGNPVRPEMIPDEEPVLRGETVVGPDKKPFTVLVCGGSQGAQALNRAVMDALTLLRDASIRWIHQTGLADEAAVTAAYEVQGVSGRVAAFYTDMARQYQEADLVVCRAGATTVAELTAMGKPALFVPYPFAADQHQMLNAQSMAAAGAAEVIVQEELTGAFMAERIAYYAGHPEVLADMAAKSRQLGRPGAAEAIVTDCYRYLEEIEG